MPPQTLSRALPVIKRFSSVTKRPDAGVQRSTGSARASAPSISAGIGTPRKFATMTKSPETKIPAHVPAAHSTAGRPQSADPARPGVALPRRGIAGAIPSIQRRFKKK